jgi:hypothetical protein
MKRTTLLPAVLGLLLASEARAEHRRIELTIFGMD